MTPFAAFACALIRRYQRGGGGAARFAVECNFAPSCSEYALTAIGRFGVLRGAYVAWLRVRRCRDRDLVERIDDPVPGALAEVRRNRCHRQCRCSAPKS
jgi:uncharacterized protein